MIRFLCMTGLAVAMSGCLLSTGPSSKPDEPALVPVARIMVDLHRARMLGFEDALLERDLVRLYGPAAVDRNIDRMHLEVARIPADFNGRSMMNKHGDYVLLSTIARLIVY